MKTFATKDKHSAPATLRSRPSRFGYVGPRVKAQQAEIRRILRSTGAQARLTVGQPNDKYEREADRVADQVMAMPDPKLQRQPEAEEEEETLQAKPLADQITPLVQRQEEPPEDEEKTAQAKGDGGPSTASPSVESGINSMRGGGHPLPPSERALFEPRLGHDLGHVRVHTDQRAAELADGLNARALTTGRNIAFAAGQYAPRSFEGRKLLAHELAHILQQAGRTAETVQRHPGGKRRRRKNIPTLNVAKTKGFFIDLNATLNKVFGSHGVKANLKLNDYDIKTPAQYVAFARTITALAGEYRTARAQAAALCRRPRALKRKYCRNKQPTAFLISELIATRGITVPTRGTALGATTVIQEATQGKMLLLILHEGLHRLRGTNWARRSKSGIAYYHSRNKRLRLSAIRTWLDEGTVQILTNHIITKMQATPRKKWFKGFTSTAYQKDVQKVNALLKRKGKGIDFLAKAYFSSTSTREVEDLQSWQ